MTMQKKLLILLLTAVAGGVAQANDANIEQATSMSEVVRMLHEQEKASRPAQKPVSEMSDEEVLAHAAFIRYHGNCERNVRADTMTGRVKSKAFAFTNGILTTI